jgi:hypothetical protein
MKHGRPGFGQLSRVVDALIVDGLPDLLGEPVDE